MIKIKQIKNPISWRSFRLLIQNYQTTKKTETIIIVKNLGRPCPASYAFSVAKKQGKNRREIPLVTQRQMQGRTIQEAIERCRPRGMSWLVIDLICLIVWDSLAWASASQPTMAWVVVGQTGRSLLLSSDTKTM